MEPLRVASFLLLCGAVACSSSTGGTKGWAPGTATLESSLVSTSPHAWASAAATRTPAGDVALLVNNLAGGTNACLAASARANVASLFQLTLSLGPSPRSGTYALGEGWQASYQLTDARCAEAGSGTASQGTLEIDGLEPSVHGIADVTFPGGRVLATFEAAFCDAAPVTGAPSCVAWSACPAGHGADPSPPTQACLAAP